MIPLCLPRCLPSTRAPRTTAVGLQAALRVLRSSYVRAFVGLGESAVPDMRSRLFDTRPKPHKLFSEDRIRRKFPLPCPLNRELLTISATAAQTFFGCYSLYRV